MDGPVLLRLWFHSNCLHYIDYYLCRGHYSFGILSTLCRKSQMVVVRFLLFRKHCILHISVFLFLVRNTGSKSVADDLLTLLWIHVFDQFCYVLAFWNHWSIDIAMVYQEDFLYNQGRLSCNICTKDDNVRIDFLFKNEMARVSFLHN